MAQDKQTGQYYFPHGSRLPFFGSASLFVLMAGAAATLNGASIGVWVLGVGFLLLCALFFFWFGEVIRENQAGALFYARQLSVPWLGGDGAKAVTGLLWPDFEASWPSNGPGALSPRDNGSYEIIPAFGLPAINTALLLTSGLTITIAHHAMKMGNRGMLKIFLALTFLLGFTFLGVQAHEYGEAYREHGLQLGTGIYGSTFFMLTGFHGLHVTVGAIMLVVIWLRCMKGHFTPHQHFAFEAVAWYWHFVDVVWLGLCRGSASSWQALHRDRRQYRRGQDRADAIPVPALRHQAVLRAKRPESLPRGLLR
ncbi:MAG: Cytochrome c oxidase subunit 3 [Steroidobacteraceae bacterium]|nr:Cytochrome c oxidase subunit 3 [Steroidobacteraceae bacterium]